MRRRKSGQFATPEEVDWDSLEYWDLEEVLVPCTAASALRDAGRLNPDDDESISAVGDLDRDDFWFRTRFGDPGEIASLVLEGLATLATVWLNGERVMESANQFVPGTLDVVDRIHVDNEIVIRFAGPHAYFRQKHPRARWRTSLVAERGLRLLRATLFGRMPSWCPPLPAVGPWAPVHLRQVSRDSFVICRTTIDARCVGSSGEVIVGLSVTTPVDMAGALQETRKPRLSVDVEGQRALLDVQIGDDGMLHAEGTLKLGKVECWWPHTHLSPGSLPRLYAVNLVVEEEAGESLVPLERVGFRRLEQDAGDRFALIVNGERIFCRGTCWTPVDPLSLRGESSELRHSLEELCAAGANMVRVPGIVVYERNEFYGLCDELGLLVWQDFMFATLDYPTEVAGFSESVRQEAVGFLQRTRSRACLAVLCGSSEGHQQPAMLGLDAGDWESSFFDKWLPEKCAEIRPDVPWWPSTPTGGVLPFDPRVGTSHYFGVGGYRRSLDDVEITRPAFATECLALANPTGVHGPEKTSPLRVPRDRGADWDFADATRHYCDALFGVKPRDSAEQAAALRATTSIVMERTMQRLRDPRADCGGALVLSHRDPWACAGWGVRDHRGRPKSAWYGLARAWAPVAVSILDEGLAGLWIQVINDRPERLLRTLEIELVRENGIVVESVRHEIDVPARGSVLVSVEACIGRFVDSSYAYKFGPPNFVLAVARLRELDAEEEPPLLQVGTVAAFNLFNNSAPMEGNLSGKAFELSAKWSGWTDERAKLLLSSARPVTCLAIEVEGAIPDDNFFILPPGKPREVSVRQAGNDSIGTARIAALGSDEMILLEPPSVKS